MAKSGKNKIKQNNDGAPVEKIVSENRRARHDYDILATVECGMVLCGSEVKSLRNGTASISEAFCRIRGNEAWLINANIPEYFEATYLNHKPTRERKLLLHHHEIARFAKKSTEKGITLIPLKIYFSNGRAKLLMGLCKGRQEFDKRQAKKDQDAKRGLRLATMKRRS